MVGVRWEDDHEVMSDPPSWHPEGGPPRPGPPPPPPPPPYAAPHYRPSSPPPVRPSASPWGLPIAFLAALGVTVVSTAGAGLGIEFLQGWALTGFLTAGCLGLAVVLSRPDPGLPDKTRSALQAIRVVAGLAVALVVAGIAFFVYLVVQALNDPNTE